MTIKFSEEYATGFLELDNQHKELFKRIKALYDACVAGKAKEEVAVMMKHLENYVSKHFEDEEGYMEKYIYKGTFVHKSDHNQFKQIFIELKKSFEKSGPSTDFIIRVNKTMVNWLIGHMGSEDKKLAEFLKEKHKNL